MAHNPNISFGTDGWRAIIGDEYTFHNVRACARALAIELEASGRAKHGVAVGYDTRFMSDRFANAAAQVLANRNISVCISDRPLPTPALSYAVTTLGAASGIMITASHNPPEWNGFKIKSAVGGSASPEEVALIEARLPDAIAMSNDTDGIRSINIPAVDMLHPYLDQLCRIVDIERIKAAGLRVVVDSMHGSGASVIAEMLDHGSTRVDEIRSEINPSFPDMKQPEPIEENLAPLKARVANSDTDIGIATDGDADRLGVVDENGDYMTALEVFAMLFHHFKARSGLPGGAVSTITMSSMMEQLAQHHRTDFFRTPIGFKYVGPKMTENGCVLGGEESGGYAFSTHIPERDGPLSGLYFLESMAKSGLSPCELLKEVHEITGPRSYRRIDIKFEAEDRTRIARTIDKLQPKDLGGIEVQEANRRDGLRLTLADGKWGVVRLSGTEPLLRLYAEAKSAAERDAILQDLRGLMRV